MPALSSPPNSAPPAPGPRRPRLSWKWWLGMLLVFAVNYAVVTFVVPGSYAPARVDVPYTLFKQQVAAGNVPAISSTADVIQGSFTHPVSFTPSGAAQA